MIVVSVGRRPLSEGTVASNVLKHGTGAININATRLRHANPDDLATSLAKNPGRDDTVTSGVYGAGRPQQSVNTSGRWPGNLILQHLDGCQKAGTTQVQAKQLTAGRRTVKWGVGEGGSSYEKGTGAQFATEDGTEPHQVWSCVPECPVADLDRQSGISMSSGGRAYQNTNDMYSGGWAHKGAGVAIDPGFGDVGGASRYFKQIGGDKDLAKHGLEAIPEHGGFILRPIQHRKEQKT